MKFVEGLFAYPPAEPGLSIAEIVIEVAIIN